MVNCVGCAWNIVVIIFSGMLKAAASVVKKTPHTMLFFITKFVGDLIKEQFSQYYSFS